MNKILNIVLKSLMPTLCMYIMVSNLFTLQNDGIGLRIFTIFTFSFAITFVLCSLIFKIEELGKKIKDIETSLEEKENKLTKE